MDRIEMVGGNFGKIGLSVEICSSVSEISISLSTVNQIDRQCIVVRPKSKYSDFSSYHGRHYLIFTTVLDLLDISILIFVLGVIFFKFC